MTPEQIISKIAVVANEMAFQSGEPALEMAGMIVSCLAARPELTEDFMQRGARLFIDGALDFPRDMSLSYRARNGEIMQPSQLRDHIGHTQ